MKFPSVYPTASVPLPSVVFAASKLTGAREVQEDSFSNFADECFVVADGVGNVPHGEVASRLATETAIWGYKHVRQRPFYWEDKKRLLKRIFRTTNLTIWQKQRENEFKDGLATTLSVAIVSAAKIWVGGVGDSPVFLYREGLIDVLTPVEYENKERTITALGFKRLGVEPDIACERFLPGDVVMMLSDGVSQFVSEDELRTVCELIDGSEQSVNNAVVHLLQLAGDNGSDDNRTALIFTKPQKTGQ